MTKFENIIITKHGFYAPCIGIIMIIESTTLVNNDKLGLFSINLKLGVYNLTNFD
jgi:hypothetical protein